MNPRQSARLRVCGGALLAFLGVWLGHTAEYVRVWGISGIRQELIGSIHLYMLPLAGVLVVLAAMLARRYRRAWNALGHRLVAARVSIAAAWRGRRPVAPPRSRAGEPASLSGRLFALWVPLSIAQIGLFLLQENLEAVRAGVPAPGFGAVSGVHWAAPLLHAAVAFVLAALVVGIRRRLRARVTAVVRAENAVRSYLLRVGRVLADRPREAAWLPSPVERLGAHVWSRPPPHLLLVAAG